MTGKGHRPVRDFRTTWENLCEKIGRPELTPHDFRRSAARNLRRAGVSENTIMAIGGWETSSVFRRHDIHTNKDKEVALVALKRKRIADQAERDAQREAENSQSFSHNQASEPQHERKDAKGMIN